MEKSKNKNLVKKIVISLILGTIITFISLVAITKTSSSSGSCSISSVPDCGGYTTTIKGYPLSYYEESKAIPDRRISIDYYQLSFDILFWSIITFIMWQSISWFKNKKLTKE